MALYLRKQKDPRIIAEGLAKGLTQMQAVQEAGYAASTAQKHAYAIVKRPLVQSALTDACERIMKQRHLTLDQVIEPYFDGLKATVVVKSTQLGDAQKTNVPDIPLRMEAADRIVNLFGAKPGIVETLPQTSKGLVVIIQKDKDVTNTTTPVDMTPKTKIHPRGEGTNPPLPVRIVKQDDA